MVSEEQEQAQIVVKEVQGMQMQDLFWERQGVVARLLWLKLYFWRTYIRHCYTNPSQSFHHHTAYHHKLVLGCHILSPWSLFPHHRSWSTHSTVPIHPNHHQQDLQKNMNIYTFCTLYIQYTTFDQLTWGNITCFFLFFIIIIRLTVFTTVSRDWTVTFSLSGLSSSTTGQGTDTPVCPCTPTTIHRRYCPTWRIEELKNIWKLKPIQTHTNSYNK